MSREHDDDGFAPAESGRCGPIPMQLIVADRFQRDANAVSEILGFLVPRREMLYDDQQTYPVALARLSCRDGR